MALRSKVAIITGASSGIGAGIAEHFARNGAKLSLTGRNKDNLDSVAKRCRDYSAEDVITTVGDITADNVRKTLVQETCDKFKKIDIVVNNSGIAEPCSLTRITPDHYDRHMDINLRSPFFLTALVIPHLIESKGCVLNISSAATVLPNYKTGVYAMSKSGLDMYTKVLARELGPLGVRVNSINPGFVATNIFYVNNMDAERVKSFSSQNAGAKFLLEFFEHVGQDTPLRRIGTSEEIAKIATFLVSDESSFITGETLIADGGVTLTRASSMSELSKRNVGLKQAVLSRAE